MGNGSPPASTKVKPFAPANGIVRAQRSEARAPAGLRPPETRLPSAAQQPQRDAGARDAVRFFRGLLVAVLIGVVGWGALAAAGFGIYLLAT